MEELNSNIVKNKNILCLNIKILDNDYKEIAKKFQIMKESGYLAMNENKIKTYENQSDIQSNEEQLFSIRIKKNIIKLEKPIRIEKIKNFQTEEEMTKLETNRFWVLLPSKNNDDINYQNTFQLYEGDLIKIGKMKYIVYEINIISNNENNKIKKYDKNDYGIINKDTDEIFARIPEIKYEKCKFCDTYNVHLCDCGNKIHYKCFETKIKKDILYNLKNIVNTFILDNYNCKKCNSPFPISFQLGDSTIIYDIIDIERPDDTNYIILESVNHKNEQGRTKKYVHLINLNKGIIKIGRNKSNDLIIDDPSVEDVHAQIEYDKKNEGVIISNISKENDVAILIKKRSLQMNKKKIQIQLNRIKFEAFIK